ncbi:pH-response regulator protein palH/rim21 [Diatrype stigma]|uniref:PH-response regulator protein palH/rim21 n=1 Tax=Diatrype stigma TaxID=117547 RepID=A0AAN9UGP1_9PEZI
MDARQDWQSSSEAAITAIATATSDIAASLCSPSILPANGVLSLPGLPATTLAADAFYRPECSQAPQPAIIANGGVNIDQTSNPEDFGFSDFRDPFYASIFPQCYALAATTVLAYVLFIMLIIVPRSFLDGGVVVLGRRGFTNGPRNGISIGGRPWLQKVASLTVTISLTIATGDTFRVAEQQYGWGIQNASELQAEVLGGTQLKSIQLISDTFLWLAQAQTLIRLFPRQREKIIIKWTAFSLISLDVIFGALNSFHYTGQGQVRPRNFTEAVPALSYLFQLSLGLLYAAWVIYYSLMKKRYAFYHPLMKNVSFIAMLSIFSILVPVVFFILDIAEPQFTGWGEYVRWVGAAAASVVVWEWVERIEALEREEKKDGILGREVFDGDEMMDVSPSELSWPRRRKGKKKGGDGDGNGDGGESGYGTSDLNQASAGRSNMWPAMSSIASRYRSRAEGGVDSSQEQSDTQATLMGSSSEARNLQPPPWLSRPPPAVTPVSRTDTASADSTVYAVRYQHQPPTESVSRSTDERPDRPASRGGSNISPTGVSPSEGGDSSNQPPAPQPSQQPSQSGVITERAADNGHWHRLTQFNPFRSSSHGPPAEIVPHTNSQQQAPRRSHENRGRWDLRGRFEDFAATHAEKVMEKIKGTPDTESLEVTVIPAPPRRGAALSRLLEEEEDEQEQSSAPHHEPYVTAVPASAMMSTGNTSGIGPATPGLRSTNMPSNPMGPMLRPVERRDDTLQLRPPNHMRYDGASLSPTGPRGRDQPESVSPSSTANLPTIDEARQRWPT